MLTATAATLARKVRPAMTMVCGIVTNVTLMYVLNVQNDCSPFLFMSE
jgi:hypothetical protein